MLRYIIPAGDYNTKHQIIEAMRKGLYRYNQTKGRFVFISPTVEHRVLEEVFGKSFRKLLTGFAKKCGSSATFESLNTYSNPQDQDIIIGIFLGPNILDDIDDINGINRCSSIILTESYECELDVWRRRWGIDTDRLENYQTNTLSVTIRKGLDEFDFSFNKISPSLRDIEKAKTAARVIYKFEPSTNSEDMKNYLIRKLNFTPPVASKVAGFLETLQEGKYFHGGQKKGLDEIYKGWQARPDFNE
jgi:hypothetical protein